MSLVSPRLLGRIAVTAHSLNGQCLATAFVDLPMKCDPAAIADLFTSVGRSGVCDDFATLFNAEQTSGATTVGVTKFQRFFERFKDTLTCPDFRGVVAISQVFHTDIADVTLSGVQDDDLVLSIAKHLDSPKGREGQPQDVTDLLLQVKQRVPRPTNLQNSSCPTGHRGSCLPHPFCLCCSQWQWCRS